MMMITLLNVPGFQLNELIMLRVNHVGTVSECVLPAAMRSRFTLHLFFQARAKKATPHSAEVEKGLSYPQIA